MNRLTIAIVLVAIALAASGCTEGDKARQDALEKPARVICYSAANVILDDVSVGAVTTSADSDGFYYRSRTTGKLVRTTADCVIVSDMPVPDGWTAKLP